MVMAPGLRKGPDVDLPDTAKPTEQGDERGRILVTLEETGKLWIDDKQVEPEQFRERLQAAAAAEPDMKIVLRSDARLRFGDVRQAMIAIEEAGFQGVGLIANRAGAQTGGE
jgi:biopolymer transport protein ExbD